MRTELRVLFLLAVLAAPVQATEPSWSQNLEQQQLLAMAFKKPLVIFFMGNGKFDYGLFDREPLDSIAGQAELAWVGANLKDQVTPDQIALEKKFQVTHFPTLVLMRPIKTGTTPKGDQYTFRESVRCVVGPIQGQCAKLIVMAVERGQ
jgi:hypothetical protein